MDNKRIEIYSGLAENFQIQLSELKDRSLLISISRGVLFLGIIITLFFTWEYGIKLNIILAGIFIIPFLFLIKRSVFVNYKIKHLKELIIINQNEISGLKGDHKVFEPGNEFIDPDHPYSYDLDIFGQGSIYQLMNRTCTSGGAVLLANSLKYNINNAHEINLKQGSIKELSPLLEWRQNFQATGRIELEAQEELSGNPDSFQYKKNISGNESKFHNEMISWLEGSFFIKYPNLLKNYLLVMPLISIVLFLLMLTDSIPVMSFILYGLIQLLVIGFNLKKINQIHEQIGRKTQILKKYGSLLSSIESQNFESPYLQNLVNISGIKNKTAGKRLKQLQKLSAALDNRMNLLFSIVANAYLSWDLQVIFRIEKWRKNNSKMMLDWFNVIYEFDSLSGYAAFSYNNPEYCFPEVIDGQFVLEVQQTGHPIISADLRVNNDLKIWDQSQLLVITGANMAGKSTFLRTVGVNMVLAMAGSAVCAEKFKISPIAMHTSIRTSDSVQKSESYFFAELKRLKQIIDRMKTGEKLFIIIDEMLRGTNSKDKHQGSQALIEQLIRLQGSGLLATHDIALGELAERYPENVKNYRFEVEIENNELVFDYKLKSGISQNLNATFLMRKMGITL